MIRKVEGLEKYFVSDEGNIYRNKGEELEIITPSLTNKGKYYTYCFPNCGVNYQNMIHRVVAHAFPEICGEWFEGCVVDHIDGNGLNNKASNLRVCTQKENCNNPITVERLRKSMTNNPNNYLKGRKGLLAYNHSEVNQYDMGGNLIAHYDCIEDAFEQTKINNISAVCRGKRNSAGGYKWAYAE